MKTPCLPLVAASFALAACRPVSYDAKSAVDVVVADMPYGRFSGGAHFERRAVVLLDPGAAMWIDDLPGVWPMPPGPDWVRGSARIFIARGRRTIRVGRVDGPDTDPRETRDLEFVFFPLRAYRLSFGAGAEPVVREVSAAEYDSLHAGAHLWPRLPPPPPVAPRSALPAGMQEDGAIVLPGKDNDIAPVQISPADDEHSKGRWPESSLRDTDVCRETLGPGWELPSVKRIETLSDEQRRAFFMTSPDRGTFRAVGAWIYARSKDGAIVLINLSDARVLPFHHSFYERARLRCFRLPDSPAPPRPRQE